MTPIQQMLLGVGGGGYDPVTLGTVNKQIIFH